MMRNELPFVGVEDWGYMMRSEVALFVSGVEVEARDQRVERLSRSQSSRLSQGLEMEEC
jgi:hypothetical protein